MKKQDILSILITFGFGVAAGVYLFIMTYAPLISDYRTPDSEKLSEFIITGEIYGGCHTSCPSFQILGDGTYHYLYTPEAGQEQVLRQGTLPMEYQRSLRKNLTESAIKKQARNTEPATCSSYSDGNDVAYEITYKGTEYKIDSCGTAVVGDSKLWLTLLDVWGYFKTLGNN